MARTIGLESSPMKDVVRWTEWTPLKAGASTSKLLTEHSPNIQVRNLTSEQATYRVRGQNPTDVHDYSIDAGEPEPHTKHGYAQVECSKGNIEVRFRTE